MVVFIICSYSVLTQIASSLALYLYDLLSVSNNNRPNIRIGANRTDKCALKTDIYFQGKALERHELLAKLSYYLEFFAEPFVSMLNVSSAYYFVLATFHLVYYYSNLVLFRSVQLPMDFVNFLLNPIKERRKVRNELCKIIHNLVNSSLDFGDYESQGFTKVKSRNLSNCTTDAKQDEPLTLMGNKSLIADELEIRFQGTWNMRRRRHRQLSCIKENYDRQKFIRSMCDESFVTTIKPANLSLKWHQMQLNILKLTLLFNHICYLNGVTLLFIMVPLALKLRTERRLSLIKCSQWNSNATSLEYSYAHLDELSSNEDFSAYLAYNETLSSTLELIKLIFFVEAKNYFSLKRVVRLIIHQTYSALSSTGISYNIIIFVHIHLDKLIWLEQITKQVDCCILGFTNILQKQLSASSSRETNSTDKKFNLDVEVEQILKLVAKSYSNFELFRRKQENYRIIANLMLIQEFGEFLLIFLICYLIGSRQFDQNNAFLIYACTFIVFVADFYLILGALLTNKVNKLMKRLTILIAKSVELSPQKKRPAFAIDLWRRQMIGELETKKLLAPNLLGLHLSFGKLVSLNLYLILIGMVLYKVNL